MASASALKEEGNARFKVGEFAEAVELYTKSLALDATQHLCYSNRSAASLKLNDAEAALRDAEKCVELNPQWAKGYNRQAAALQALKRWDEAARACETGLEAAGADDSLRKMLQEVRNRQFQDQIQGAWHGQVTETLGGYDQQMEFMDDGQVRVEVVGRSIVGMYWVDCTTKPFHLDIQVPMQDIPPGVPMPPPVPYIAKLDSAGLHLCCPVMSMDRPTTFDGPGYCLMHPGPLAVGNDDVAHLSEDEKRFACLRELLQALPNRKIEEVSQSDSEDVMREKLMAQVKFETSMFTVQKRYGEEVMREVLGATRDGDVQCLRGSKELAELSAKLLLCGLADDVAVFSPPLSASSASKPAAAAVASVGSTKAEVASKEDPPSAAEEKADTSATLVVGVAVVAALAAAALAFVLVRKRRG